VTAKARLVIPCFNEELRLDRARFLAFARDHRVDLLFVDDGSSDDTRGVLEELRRQAEGRVDVLALEKNSGKGEAVRQGLTQSIAGGHAIVGYADADLSTPPVELLKLLTHFERPPVQVVTGARVMLIGRHIELHRMRHILGRIFASIAETILRMPFYDTQCGAKFFRASPLLSEALAAPFLSRWAFDIELLGRLLVGVGDHRGLVAGEVIEVPLDEWIDVDGSKLHFGSMARTLVDLAKIEVEIEKLRAERARREAARGPAGP
jgi:dolichyl-phosphate beta-glucosyltransferase